MAKGNLTHLNLPKYIAVKVSAERWCIATLFDKPDSDGYSFPEYVITSDPMKEGRCNNTLSELQRQEREKNKETERGSNN